MAANKSKNKIWWILLGICLLIGIGLFVAKKMEWIGKEPDTEVEFTKVLNGEIIETVSASGKIQPEVEVKISPDVSGEIIALNINEGDSVTKGQLLMKIRPDNYESFVERGRATVNQSKASTEQARAALAQQEAQLLKAKLDLDRQQKLYDQKVGSLSDLQIAETNYKVILQQIEAAKANINAGQFAERSAEAALKDASDNLRKTTIFAPQNGIISKLGVELGERVVGTSQMAGTELMRIANLNNMEVRINVNENDIVRVSLGDTALIDVDAYSSIGKKFKGIVYEIASTANGIGGSTAAAAASTDAVTEFEVKIRILKSSYDILKTAKLFKKYPFKPGMTATVDIITERKKNILTVPIAAVTTRGKDFSPEGKKEDGPPSKEEDEKKEDEKNKKKEAPKEVVFVNDKGKAKMKEVKTGITDTNQGTIEVISGLSANDEIISGPYNIVSKKLKDGDKIKKKTVEKPKDK
jgi:HlyD family secretion protein